MFVLFLTASDGVWIELTYSKGDSYHSHCNKAPRSARLIFLCDPLVNGLVCEHVTPLIWCIVAEHCSTACLYSMPISHTQQWCVCLTMLPPVQGSFDFLEENRDENVCFYTFSVAAKGVCGYQLGAGDIILIMYVD